MGGMQLQDALQDFLVQLRADGRSPHTVGQYRRHVTALEGWLERTRRRRTLASIDHRVLAAFLVDDAATQRPDGRPKKATSTNALRTSLRVFFRYCAEAGYLRENPARLVRRARCSPPPPRALTEAEVECLLGAVDAGEGEAARRDAALIRLMLGTGLRLSSALALRTDDVDLEHGEMRVHTTKGDRPLALPLSPTAVRDMRVYTSAHPPGLLFPGGNGEALSRRQAARRLAIWAERAGLVGRATAHALRHTFATALYAQTGGDLLLVQQALGHRSVTSTQVYATVAPGRLREILQR